MAASEELLKQMYDSNLASQKAGLKSDYDSAVADLDAQKLKNRQATDVNLSQTYADSKKQQVNAAEYYAAAGLSSGAKAQARIAQDNQLLADLTAIRTAQQTADADVERQRGLLSQQYATAIRQAQADNDMARAQALYEAAREAEASLLANRKEVASVMAGLGDFDLYAQLYGLTDGQKNALVSSYASQQEAAETEAGQAALDAEYEAKLAYAKALAEETGDFDAWLELLTQGKPVYTSSRQVQEETFSLLREQYPGGIYDSTLWQSLLKEYGAAVLAENGLYFVNTPYTAPAGQGGRTQDVTNGLM